MEYFIVGAELMIWKREREMQNVCRAGRREEQDCEPLLYNIDFETCESISIVRRQNHDSYMNRFLHATPGFLFPLL